MSSDLDRYDEESFAGKSESSLKKDVGRDEDATRILKQIIRDRDQRHGQRRLLFILVMAIVPVSLVATLVMMTFVLMRREAGDIVYVAFISAMAAQAFALVATLAKNLYQREAQVEAKGGGDVPE